MLKVSLPAGGRLRHLSYKQDQERYISILREYYKTTYKERDRAQRLSYRHEADRLLTHSGLKWIDPLSNEELPPPQEDRLRKFILPPSAT